MTDIACVVQSHDALGESCIWCPATGRIWWVDILKPCLQSFEPATGAHRVFPLAGRNCGCLALRKGRRPGVGHRARLAWVRSGDRPARASPRCRARPARQPLQRRTLRPARPPLDRHHAQRNSRASGSFYRIEPDRSVPTPVRRHQVPNSTTFAPDDRTLYSRLVSPHDLGLRFRYRGGRDLKRRVFADLTNHRGAPDGSCVDAEAFSGTRNSAANASCAMRRTARRPHIDLPVTNPTCCCFGGPGLDTLYVTSSTHRHKPAERDAEPYGGTAALDVGVRGLPEAAFGG